MVKCQQNRSSRTCSRSAAITLDRLPKRQPSWMRHFMCQ